MDVDNLLAGQRFDRELDRALSQCDVLIAILGPRWMDLLSRAEGERDFVRDEIAAALKRDIVVIPVLVGREGHMPALPQANDLPEEIRELVLYQKHSVSHETFGRDTGELIAAIAAVLRGRRPPKPVKPLLIGAGAALVAALLLLIYQFGLVSWMQASRQTRGADPHVATVSSDAELAKQAEDEAAQRKAEEAKKVAQENARRKTAEEEARKKAAEEEAKKAAEENARRKAAEEEAQSKAAEEEARKKAEEEQQRKKEEEARKRAEDETRKKSAQEAEAKRESDENARIADACDRLAASPDDSSRPAGIPGVESTRIDGEAAWNSCSAAMTLFPDVARFIFQAGRAAHSRRDYDRAMVLYRKASEAGSAAGASGAGFLYERGLGVPQSDAEASKWYEKAAGLGYGPAMNNLGQLYHYGRGVTQDYKEARKWYEKAAALGNANAMTSLGFSYDRGAGVAQDYTEARKWYEKAAALGFGQAMSNLGFLYEKGRGVTQDYREARKWYEKGATLGNAFAMNNLGALYDSGAGMTQNFAEARKWFEKHWRCGISATCTKEGAGLPKIVSRPANGIRRQPTPGMRKPKEGSVLSSDSMGRPQ